MATVKAIKKVESKDRDFTDIFLNTQEPTAPQEKKKKSKQLKKELLNDRALEILEKISPEFVPLYAGGLKPQKGEVWGVDRENRTVRPYAFCDTKNTGWVIPENIIIIDIDDGHGEKRQGSEVWKDLCVKLKLTDQGKATLAVRTKRGGAHLYYSYAGDTFTLQSNPDTADVLEIKKYKGLIRAPGCKGYETLNNLDIAEFPKVLESYFKIKNTPAGTSKSNVRLGNIDRDIIEKEFAAAGAYWKGSEYWTINPTREDKKVNSFSINESGQWFDYATGTGGYIARLYSEWKNISYQEAMKIFNPTICSKEVFTAEKGKSKKKELKLPENMITLSDLSKKEIPPLEWIIPGIIPEGLTIIGGAPKAGKSFFVLNTVLQVATGSKALGNYPTKKGKILYLALEDSERRLQDRMKKTGYDVSNISGSIATEWGEGYIENMSLIDLWMEKNPDTKLIAIDTIQDFSKIEEGNNYSEVTLALSKLKELAHKYNIGIIIVHHTKKSESDNAIHNLIGSVGFSSKPDTIIILTRKKNDKGKLDISGRDINPLDLKLKFDSETLIWLQDKNAPEEQKTDQRQEIVELLAENPKPMSPGEIAQSLDRTKKATQTIIYRMKEEGEIISTGYGWYTIPTPANQNPELIVNPF